MMSHIKECPMNTIFCKICKIKSKIIFFDNLINFSIEKGNIYA